MRDASTTLDSHLLVISSHLAGLVRACVETSLFHILVASGASSTCVWPMRNAQSTLTTRLGLKVNALATDALSWYPPEASWCPNCSNPQSSFVPRGGLVFLACSVIRSPLQQTSWRPVQVAKKKLSSVSIQHQGLQE
jgi:hypothetical protein